MINKIERAFEIYHHEGIESLANAILRHVRSRLLPIPAVTDPNSMGWVFLFAPFHNWHFSRYYGAGIDVIDEDWDTLILLDACRLDDFESVNHIRGDLSSRISRGVDSYQFISENFVNRRLHDTVYVTANPHVSLLNGDEFHAVITDPLDDWDGELGCVRPESVTKAATDAHRQFPNKRIIVHYMQPHDPPLGSTGQLLRNNHQVLGMNHSDSSQVGDRVMPLVAKGVISTATARQAYRETLSIVLEEVKSLAEVVDGKVVVSADHGEHFGEKPYTILPPLYEHYKNPRTVELCKVPWLILDSSEGRREIETTQPDEESAMNPKTVDIQLKALGYRK